MISLLGIAVKSCNSTSEIGTKNAAPFVFVHYDVELLYDLTSDTAIGPLAFLESSLVPKYYSRYNFAFGGASVETFNPVLVEKKIDRYEQTGRTSYHAVVSCQYKTIDQTENDENKPYTFSTSLIESEHIMAYDLNGTPVVNSAADVFYDPVMRKYYEMEFRVSRTEYTNPMPKIYEYSNSVNATAFWGWAAGTLRMSIEASRDLSDVGFSVNYVLRTNSLGWQPRILDQGFRYLRGGKKRLFLDDEGVPVDKPRNLSGGVYNSGDPVFLPFQAYVAKEFGNLRLPTINTYVPNLTELQS